jgi:predicted RNA-binding Zn ribbon-like protein
VRQTTRVIRTPYKSFAEKVDGLVLPLPFGGHPALDFCNTFAGWGDAESGDYLTSYDHLAVWAAAYGLIDEATAGRLRRRAAREPAEARAALDRAVRFRGALYEVLTSEGSPAAWRVVSSDAEAAAAASVLDHEAEPVRWRLPDRVGLALPRLAVARSAAELLTSADRRYVGRCPGTGCGWLFLDPTGRRRWCTMATCGNRAKVRRHQERAKARAHAAVAS